MNALTNLSPAQLRRAADLQERIQGLQSELNAILDITVESAPAEAPRKRRMSAAGRRAIAAAAKARWTKYNAAKGTAPAKPGRKRKMSAAGRAAIAAAAKARWARAKAQGKTTLG
jgi:hypothetical protein